jgi:hypothetical protein
MAVGIDRRPGYGAMSGRDDTARAAASEREAGPRRHLPRACRHFRNSW